MSNKLAGGVFDMHSQRPDVSDEDLGIRAFKLQKVKAVERAVQHIRHGLGTMWSELTTEEIEELEWVLGEVWAYVAHRDWDGMPFGRLTLRDIIKILTLGSELRRHARSDIEILREVRELIDAETPYQDTVAE
jgi:cobalamin biosynthesis protein CbiD